MTTTPEQLAAEPALITIINSNSPLRLDVPMGAGADGDGAPGQPVVMTPFTLAGAMSPVTLAGALTQQNAEALFMIALAQLVRPGTPVAYGGFTSNVDMRTGAPAFGTPEYAKAAHGDGAAHAPLPASLPLQQRERVQHRRCAGDLRIRPCRSGAASWAASTCWSMPPAGSKAASPPRSRS